MKWIMGAAAAVTLLPVSTGIESRAIIHDPVALNIGVNCQWQSRCMAQQRSAMKRALAYVDRSKPPQWRVQLCNRNAGRGRGRVDWVGFDHCIRNTGLKAPIKRTRR